MTDTTTTIIEVTVHVGPYATVRAIEKSGLKDITYTGIIAETSRTYVYRIEGSASDR